MLPTPYADLNGVLREFADALEKALGRDLLSVCLQGSFAVGDFDRDSDVDFIVIVDGELSGDRVQSLQVLHDRIYRLSCPWAQHLEGSYFPKDVVRDYRQSGGPLWYLEHGWSSLVRSNHCNTALVRRVVREHGIVLAGQEPAPLIDPIPVEIIRDEMMRVINDWGREILREPGRFANRFYQSFIVLSYCRMLHDLREGRPGSKRAGAEWAKATLDPSWIGLIDRSWSGRPNPAVSVRQPADPNEFELTLDFVRYMLERAARCFPDRPEVT